jgi:hypothetical protein
MINPGHFFCVTPAGFWASWSVVALFIIMSALRAFHHSNRLISLQALAAIYCFNHINGLDRGQLSLQTAMKMLIAQHINQ